MAKSKAAGFRDRIKELRRVPASSLLPNPKNWRTHPQAQQDALRGILSEIGIADAVLARELPDGSLMLIDGHLRAETVADAKVPVLILDVTESEADKLLATLDPLAAMAATDAAAFEELLHTITIESEALQQLMASTANAAGIFDENAFAEEVQPSEAKAADTDRDYGASAIRQIVLVFEHAQYESVIEALGEHAEKFGLSNNTEVILHLLETNGYAISRRDPA
jgi:ParB-like chromosome segregation protein Spo0J